MSQFWRAVIRPFLEALEAPIIVEIGALFGGMTLKLLELASEQGGVVHVIDPEPRFDVAATSKRFGESMQFHRARSLQVLAEIESAGAVLIDGDHNWYTVHGELQQLEANARRDAHGFPLVMLHDVDWPYARRDLYYSPESVPAQWRQPLARRGVVWGQSQLSETGGINETSAHALVEGGPRNGVLTAVEDFIDESDLELNLQLLPGFHGLGLLAESNLLDKSPSVRVQWDRLSSAQFMADHAQRLALAATQAEAERLELARQLAETNRKLDGLAAQG